MRAALAPLTLVSGLAFAALCAADGDDESAIPTAEAEAAFARFEQSCAVCHPVPDPAFPMDRAWITDVQDTA